MTQSKNFYILSSSIVFLLITLFLFISAGPGSEDFWVRVYVGFALFIFFHQCFASIVLRKDKGWVHIDIFFLIMFFFVMFWVWLADILGMVEIGAMPSTIDPLRVNYGLALTLMGMSAFVLGFNVIASSGGQQRLLEFNHKDKWLKIGNVIFYTGFIFTVLYTLTVGASAFEGRYEGSDVGNLAVRTMYMLQGIFLKLGIVMVVLCKSRPNKWIPEGKVQISLYVGILLMYLVLGDRSEFVASGAVLLFAYVVSFRNIPLVPLLVAILCFSFISSASRIARSLDERSFESLIDVATAEHDEVSVEAGFANISGSGFLTLTAVSAVPAKFDYFKGDLKKQEFLGIIPFGRALFSQQNSSTGKQFHGTSQWLTWYILGPHSNWGVGSNVIADLYLDFGSPGVLIGMIILGLTAGYFKKKAASSTSFILIVMYCYYAGLLTILPRYTFLVILRGILWPLALLWVIDKAFIPKRKASKKKKDKIF
jgi:hypothetical protein